ncbi:c-type cytochrome [Roseovarius sp. B08]|uniref:c-type cytochrome n=1 Tax=Roseovarius sp. B08 TaxID=3449223 RepID=UPI003EDC4BA2
MKHALMTAALMALVSNAAFADQDVTEEVRDADVEAGESLYQSVCRNCHGPKAQGVASYPRLSDKDTGYLTNKLERYREGEKIGPNSMLMIPHAKNLSDQDILNITTYITTEFQ